MTPRFLSLAAIAAIALIGALCPAPSAAQEILRILAWAGYADADTVREFETRHGAAVEVTYANSDDDLWYKINSAAYDVFAVNTAELQRYIDRHLVQALDPGRLANHARQLPRFRDLNAIPGLVRQGQVFAIPYTYAEMGLIYNRKTVAEAPRSMAAMWDPAYRGRVLAFNTSNHNFSLVGLLLGAADPFRLSDRELATAARELAKLRRNVLTFYSTAEEAVELFTRHDVALVFGNYGNQQLKALRDAGADVGYVIPQEGALAWLDCWAVTRNTGNPDLAAQWIDYTLEPAVSERLSIRHGLANTVTVQPGGETRQKLVWLEPVANPELQKWLWDRILSGEPPEAF
ncbi:spermidine/putrescine ABC transporter substrate-binding protein [Methylomonas koyamae]|uniref:Spermidine/putrescine ABC transporter substrate-binding protein n=1 Tax=Methylomonas koyamae TaxID=702114 RepID=A0A177NNH4_9GAMM|nr:extracellular solute-binding protein [Methylomonas koyamae]OAI19104.1 spermidine/putrescine ABC transporter substrate-binding protein [Methylomonas koyamae]